MIVIEERFVQPSNRLSFIEVNELPIVAETSPLQYLKLLWPISITEFGIIKDPVKPQQLLKQSSPIDVTELDRIMPSKP